MMTITILRSIALFGLWVVIVVQDLTERRVSVLALAGLTLLALPGQPWPWWVLTWVAMLWPWRRNGLALPPVMLAVGILAGAEGWAPALALAVGIAAWSLGWWGAADSVVLIVLGMRYGMAGLLVGAAVSAGAALMLMMIRGRSLRGLFAIVGNVLVTRQLPSLLPDEKGEEDVIPADAEMPAAAALAAAGLAMEVITWV
jgi:hypothetical protein